MTDARPSVDAHDEEAGTNDAATHDWSAGVPPSSRGHVQLLRRGPALSRRAMRFVVAVPVAAAAFGVGGMVLLWPHHGSTSSLAGGAGAQQVDAVVVAVAEIPWPPPADPSAPTGQAVRCGVVTVKLSGGPDRGEQVYTDVPGGPGAPVVHPGDEVVLTRTEGATTAYEYQIADHRRSTQLWVLLAVFVLAVVAFGRLRGLAALPRRHVSRSCWCSSCRRSSAAARRCWSRSSARPRSCCPCCT